MFCIGDDMSIMSHIPNNLLFIIQEQRAALLSASLAIVGGQVVLLGTQGNGERHRMMDA